MNRHLCFDLNCGLLLPLIVFFHFPTPAFMPPAPSISVTPPLAERRDYPPGEFERNRIDLSVPGAALAIVRSEETAHVEVARFAATLQPSLKSDRGK